MVCILFVQDNINIFLYEQNLQKAFLMTKT